VTVMHLQPRACHRPTSSSSSAPWTVPSPPAPPTTRLPLAVRQCHHHLTAPSHRRPRTVSHHPLKKLVHPGFSRRCHPPPTASNPNLDLERRRLAPLLAPPPYSSLSWHLSPTPESDSTTRRSPTERGGTVPSRATSDFFDLAQLTIRS
jgi:hypothetical protein